MKFSTGRDLAHKCARQPIPQIVIGRRRKYVHLYCSDPNLGSFCCRGRAFFAATHSCQSREEMPLLCTTSGAVDTSQHIKNKLTLNPGLVVLCFHIQSLPDNRDTQQQQHHHAQRLISSRLSSHSSIVISSSSIIGRQRTTTTTTTKAHDGPPTATTRPGPERQRLFQHWL